MPRLIVFAVCIVFAYAPFTGNYPTGTADTTDQTVTVTNGKDVGSCSCDLTEFSCDNSCCCDPDCPAGVLTLWLSDSS